MSSIRGGFGHVSLLNAASDLVTHAHTEVHLIIWLEGTPGSMQIGESHVALGPDVAAGVNSFEPHSHSFPEGCKPGLFLAFYINPDWALTRRGLPPGAQLFRQAAIKLPSWVHGTAAGLFDRLRAAPEGDELLGYEIERLIDSLLDAAGAGEGRAGMQVRHAYDFRVRKAMELMKANVSERMSLDEVARAVGLSRPHFFALFKAQTNLTPNVYWNTLRMQEALRQLQTTHEPLTAVACNLGFTTQGNFTRFFRDHAGVPPTLYREAARLAG
jgi:AraC family transcriptional regulator